MEPVETIKVNERKIFCEGDSRSSLGHPRVYLDLSDRGDVDCPYCGRRYILEKEQSKDD